MSGRAREPMSGTLRHSHMVRLRLLHLMACPLIGGTTTACAGQARPALSEPTPSSTCDVPESGPVSIEQLPAGSSVKKCDAVGRTVVWEDMGAVIPKPGSGVFLHVSPANTKRAVDPTQFAVHVSEGDSSPTSSRKTGTRPLIGMTAQRREQTTGSASSMSVQVGDGS